MKINDLLTFEYRIELLLKSTAISYAVLLTLLLLLPSFSAMLTVISVVLAIPILYCMLNPTYIVNIKERTFKVLKEVEEFDMSNFEEV